jgi:hypothetical protein
MTQARRITERAVEDAPAMGKSMAVDPGVQQRRQAHLRQGAQGASQFSTNTACERLVAR